MADFDDIGLPTLNEVVADEAWISAYARKVVAQYQPTPPPSPEKREPRYVSPDQVETRKLINERLAGG